MSHLTRVTAIALLLCLSMVGAQAQAPAVRNGVPAVSPDARLREVDRDPKLYEQYFRTGKRVAAFCANCHGEGGNSVKTDVPNLAGQNTSYLLNQVRQFSDGRRKNEFMEGLMKVLSNDEKVGIAVFYASQEVVHRPARDAALAAKGKAYYDRICFRCHGESGHGSDQYARIAGQQPDYLTQTLRRYRDGTGNRVDALMAANTRGMSDSDIQAVVAYVTAMR